MNNFYLIPYYQGPEGFRYAILQNGQGEGSTGSGYDGLEGLVDIIKNNLVKFGQGGVAAAPINMVPDFEGKECKQLCPADDAVVRRMLSE